MPIGRVDRYDLLDLIGQGSFGAVYRARHVHTGQMHALKLARGSIDPDAAQRVLSEARAAAGLRHPNIVAVSDGGMTPEGEAFVVMELLGGMTIAQLIAQHGPLPLERAAHIARQMLDGLAAAHASGIVHRDIKPSNVFVVSGELVKVIDFGISKIRPDAAASGVMTLPGVALGTPGYMAPEQLGDARSVDGRADVYAVGATLFEMLTGRKPIEADSFETWMRRLRMENATPLASVNPRIPPALCGVVDRALARDPDARWPSALAMRQALDQAVPTSVSPTVIDTPRVVVQVASHPPPRPTGPPMPPPSGGSALPWIAAVLAGLIAVVALGVFGALLYLGRMSGETTAAATSPTTPPPSPTRTAAPILTAPPLTTTTTKPTASTAPPPPSPPSPPKPSGPPRAQFSAPKIVGELRQDAFFELAERARPAIERCNSDQARRWVKIDVMIGMGKITIAQPAVNDDHGDTKIARCCANAMKDAQWPGFKPGDSGIYSSAEITWK